MSGSHHKRVALFFGSFNPIHVGHLVIAQNVLNEQQADEVWFVVSPHNPHKEKKSLLKDHHRMAMVREAIQDQPLFRVNDIEFHLDQPSYTVNTLVHLREKYTDTEFSLLMGEDNLRTFHKWKNPEEIVRYHGILVYNRKADDSEDYPYAEHAAVTYLQGEFLDISATYIRQLIADGKDARYLLTESVYKYVNEMGFYR